MIDTGGNSVDDCDCPDQLPAMCTEGVTRGVTLVFSPLLSLIFDQCRHLHRLSVPVIAYTGEMTGSERDSAHEALTMPEPLAKIVYITPEMMAHGEAIKEIVKGLLLRKRLARFVVDEAHCVSQVRHESRSFHIGMSSWLVIAVGPRRGCSFI